MLTFITTRKHEFVEGIRVLDNTKELCEWLNYQSEISIDIETDSLDPLIAQIFLISIGNEQRQYVLDYLSIDCSFINNYRHLLFVGHNIKYDYTVLKHNGIILDQMYDTLIVEQRLGMGSGRKNALDKVIKRRLGITTKTEKEATRSSFVGCNGIFNTNQIIYSGEDVEHLIKIKAIHAPLIERYKMEFLIYDIEFPLIKILGNCELTGLHINKERWIEIIQEKIKEEKELKLKLDEIVKQFPNSEVLLNRFKPKLRKKSLGLWKNKLKINYNSSDQIKFLFTHVGEDIPKGTRKNKDGEFEETETVGVKNLQLYLKQKPNSPLKDFIEVFIKYKKTQKHISSFGYNYLEMISPITNRLHTVYRSCSTGTGRMSSGDTKRNKPNLQQVPKLKKLRTCFSFPGYKILTIDLSSAELVILGSKAQDFRLIELNEGDMHGYLATASWKKILNDKDFVVSTEVNKDKRTEFKNVNYGILYGAGVSKIAETLNVSIDDAKLVMETLHEEIPDTFKYMEEASNFAVENGYIIFNERTNSRRWFLDITRKSIGKVKRAAINSPIQGTQSDMIKEAMVEIDRYINKTNTDALLLMQVHDELVFAFKENHTEFPQQVHDILTDVANRYLKNVKMKASYIIRDTWDKE